MHFVTKNSAFFLLALLISAPAVADAATLRIAPSSATASVGETVSVTVMVSSSDKAMNAAEGVLKFPPDILQVVALSKGASVLGVWVQEPSFSNAAGTVNFEGVALNPGYIGSNGTVLTVTFRARAAGVASLTIIGGSVLANDGNGTEILTGTSGGSISISPAAERPPVDTTPEPVAPVEQLEPAKETPIPPVQRVQKTSIEKPYDFSWILSYVRNSTWLLPLLIILFFILDALLFFQYLRLRKREGGELDHAQVLTHRSFLVLRDNVDSFVSELEAESAKRKLSPTESRFIKELRSDLSVAEKTIVKELRSAEKEIH